MLYLSLQDVSIIFLVLDKDPVVLVIINTITLDLLGLVFWVWLN